MRLRHADFLEDQAFQTFLLDDTAPFGALAPHWGAWAQ